MGKTDIIRHQINLTDPEPFKEQYQRIPPHLHEEVKQLLQDMVNVGVIHKSYSPWSSSVVLVQKKTGDLQILH